MKKTIIIAAVLFMNCGATLHAQDSVEVTRLIAKSFQDEFAGASKVVWTKADHLSLARFFYEGSVWLAYFDQNGDLYSSGRKINDVNQLPLQIQRGISKARDSQERKFGPIDTSYAIEMIGEGTTRYYVPMANNNVKLLVTVDNAGNASVSKKQIMDTPAAPAKDLVAKKD